MSVPGSINQLLIGAAGAGGDNEAKRSLRFSSGDSSYLNRTPSSAGNRRTWTWSGWVKRSELSVYQVLWSAGPGSYANLYLLPGDGLYLEQYTSSTDYSATTAALFRDPSAWYHVVLVFDSTQAESVDRIKLYVNGQTQTFSAYTTPSQNYESLFNSTNAHSIGRNQPGGSMYFNGYLADIHFIDGQALSASDFGEYDSNSVWQPKVFTGTYGTNGFKLDFSNTSSDAALGTDSSGNSNTWTVNNLNAAGLDMDQSQTWSTYGSPSSGGFALAASRGFDGNTANQTEGDTTGAYFSIPYSATVAVGGVGFFTYASGSSGKMKVYNGATLVETVDSSTGGNWRYTSSYSGAITEIRISRDSRAFEFAAVSVNGKVLVDAGVPDPLGATIDALRDSPVNGDSANDTGAGGEITGNYATWNPLFGENQSLSNGNLKAASSTTDYSIIASTLAMKSGKWYMEYTYTPNNGQPYITWGISQTNRDGSQGSGVTDTAEDKGFKAWDGGFYSQSAGSNIYNYSSSVSSGDIISLAFDADAGKLWVAKNGTYMTNASGAGNPTAGTNPDYSGLTYSGGYYFMAGPYYTNGSTLEANFGQRSWAYAAPTNYKALCTANLPEPTIADGSTVFNPALYAGNASTQSITGLNFSPDLVWTKSRSTTYSHRLYDAVRGANNWLSSNGTDANTTEANTLTSFDANGFSVGATENSNQTSGGSAVAWAWDAGSSNTTVAVGGLNTSVYYMSEVWSGDLYTADAPADAPTVTTKSFLSGYPATLPFNGDTARGSNETYAADSLKTIVFRPDTALTDVTKLEIYTNGTYTTDAGYNSATSVITGNTASGWQTLYEGTAITLNYVWAYKNNGQGAFSGLKINGRMLTDSNATPPISYPSIATTVRANPSAGFSIVKWTGTGSAATVAHGIAAPKFIITKSLANTTNWVVGHEGITWNNFMFLDTADAQGASAAVWNNTAPDSNVFSVASSSYINPAGSDVIGYCFCPVEGYSAFGSYEGNGLADGPFIYTGFKIEFLIIKSADTAQYWYLADSARSPYNDGTTAGLWANTADAEFSYDVDFLSNGFKHYNQSANLNSVNTFIYAAFASHPFRSARAR